jgi:hypothetical protein
MAKLKTLRVKDVKYAFKVFGNEKNKNPALAVFSRFPFPDEAFVSGDRKSLSEGVDSSSLETSEGRDRAVDRIVQNFLDNMSSGKIDYGAFSRECVAGFENFFYEEGEIKTLDEFLEKIPPDAARKILFDCYQYAKTEDEFTMGESTA